MKKCRGYDIWGLIPSSPHSNYADVTNIMNGRHQTQTVNKSIKITKIVVNRKKVKTQNVQHLLHVFKTNRMINLSTNTHFTVFSFKAHILHCLINSASYSKIRTAKIYPTISTNCYQTVISKCYNAFKVTHLAIDRDCIFEMPRFTLFAPALLK